VTKFKKAIYCPVELFYQNNNETVKNTVLATSPIVMTLL